MDARGDSTLTASAQIAVRRVAGRYELYDNGIEILIECPRMLLMLLGFVAIIL